MMMMMNCGPFLFVGSVMLSHTVFFVHREMSVCCDDGPQINIGWFRKLKKISLVRPPHEKKSTVLYKNGIRFVLNHEHEITRESTHHEKKSMSLYRARVQLVSLTFEVSGEGFF